MRRDSNIFPKQLILIPVSHFCCCLGFSDSSGFPKDVTFSPTHAPSSSALIPLPHARPEDSLHAVLLTPDTLQRPFDEHSFPMLSSSQDHREPEHPLRHPSVDDQESSFPSSQNNEPPPAPLHLHEAFAPNSHPSSMHSFDIFPAREPSSSIPEEETRPGDHSVPFSRPVAEDEPSHSPVPFHQNRPFPHENHFPEDPIHFRPPEEEEEEEAERDRLPPSPEPILINFPSTESEAAIHEPIIFSPGDFPFSLLQSSASNAGNRPYNDVPVVIVAEPVPMTPSFSDVLIEHASPPSREEEVLPPPFPPPPPLEHSSSSHVTQPSKGYPTDESEHDDHSSSTSDSFFMHYLVDQQHPEHGHREHGGNHDGASYPTHVTQVEVELHQRIPGHPEHSRQRRLRGRDRAAGSHLAKTTRDDHVTAAGQLVLLPAGRRIVHQRTRAEDDEPLGQRGVGGTDYPVYSAVPATSFRCDPKFPGFFADVEARCQVWHYCQLDGTKETFLCPNGTTFHQKTLVCDHWYKSDCNATPSYYHLNARLFKDLARTFRRQQKGASTSAQPTAHQVPTRSTPTQRRGASDTDFRRPLPASVSARARRPIAPSSDKTTTRASRSMTAT